MVALRLRLRIAGAPNANLLVLITTASVPTAAPALGGNFQFTGNCLFAVLVPAAEVPPPKESARWLDRTWTRVDTWVAAHAEQP